MRSKATQQNRLLRIIALPIKALSKARDLYVRSIIDCATVRPGFSGMPQLPRSYSAASSWFEETEDLRELIRASSSSSSSSSSFANNMGSSNINSGEREVYSRQMQLMRQSSRAARSRAALRSCSVGMGKIDEDKPCVFFEELLPSKTKRFGGNDLCLKTEMLLYARSKSHAVSRPSVAI